MFFRLSMATFITALLWVLVKLQINEANKHNFLTVEQLVRSNTQGLSFDRHYAMPLDFCVIAPFVGLCIVLCGAQWREWDIWFYAGLAAAVVAGLVWFWTGLPTPEAHQKGLTGVYHGAFFWVALTVILLVMQTPNPPPVLMLVMCVVVPAFLFVGNHMYLGMLNYDGAASTYPDKPLQNAVGWIVVVGGFAAVVVRSWFVIPASFWQSLD